MPDQGTIENTFNYYGHLQVKKDGRRSAVFSFG